MTTCCPTFGSYWSDALRLSVGVSKEVICLEQKAEESLKAYIEPRLVQMVPDIRYAVSESESASVSVDQETIEAAVTFASLLPRSVPVPEVSVDPDGEIAFDWIGPSKKMISVSVNKSGRLAYAGWFGEDSAVHGTENLTREFPQEIIRAVVRATR